MSCRWFHSMSPVRRIQPQYCHSHTMHQTSIPRSKDTKYIMWFSFPIFALLCIYFALLGHIQLLFKLLSMNTSLDKCFFIIFTSSITISESPVHFKDSRVVIYLITHVGTLNKLMGPHEALKWVRLQINAYSQCLCSNFP